MYSKLNYNKYKWFFNIAGESEKRLQELKTLKNNPKKMEPEKPSNDFNQCSKSFKEIAKLKNDIDQLTASLRVKI